MNYVDNIFDEIIEQKKDLIPASEAFLLLRIRETLHSD